MERRGGHAVVLGASMGGLLAARVLADYYDKVTVVERDALPDDPVNRRGVPQGRLIHTCLARLTQVLDELFPGIRDDLIDQGATTWGRRGFRQAGLFVRWAFDGALGQVGGRAPDRVAESAGAGMECATTGSGDSERDIR